ncbi:MAG: class II aldolase/adducin family protein [Candidatus Omnitrophota bacterium]
MNEQLIKDLKINIIAIGRFLWEKELVVGLNGNISARVDKDTILLTATKTCLGLLQDKDIVLMKLDGQVVGEGQASSEKLLHTEIYKNFPDVNAIIHTHTVFANAYFLERDVLVPRIFETKLYVGEVRAVDQHTPTVSDVAPVLEGLKHNNIIVLRQHGIISIGKDLFDCFLLIQYVEDAVKIDMLSQLYKNPSTGGRSPGDQPKDIQGPAKKYKLFSPEQIDRIVTLVNEDVQLKELGEKSNMTMDLAVKLDETGQVYSFRFEKGRIVNVGNDDQAEFLINAPEKIWKAVFNREIDPFVATTQKKMHLKGDFARISRWYAPCSRVFELWQNVPVE